MLNFYLIDNKNKIEFIVIVEITNTDFFRKPKSNLCRRDLYGKYSVTIPKQHTYTAVDCTDKGEVQVTITIKISNSVFTYYIRLRFQGCYLLKF